MRCPGELQAAFASESHVDRLAAAAGLDPIEFRRRNVAREGATSAVGERIRQPMAAAVLEPSRGRRPRPSVRGADTAWPSSRDGWRAGGSRSSMSVAPTVRIEIRTGLPDQGAGRPHVMARVAAAALGIAGRASSRPASTADASLDLGVGASRVTFIASRAVQDAAGRLLAALRRPATATSRYPAAAGLR